MQHLCEDLRALLVDEYLAVEFHKAHVGVLDPPASAAHHPHHRQMSQGLEFRGSTVAAV